MKNSCEGPGANNMGLLKIFNGESKEIIGVFNSRGNLNSKLVSNENSGINLGKMISGALQRLYL